MNSLKRDKLIKEIVEYDMSSWDLSYIYKQAKTNYEYEFISLDDDDLTNEYCSRFGHDYLEEDR